MSYADIVEPMQKAVVSIYSTKVVRERLGNPERCVEEDPMLRTLATGHEVACHFAEEIQSGRAAATVAAVTPPTAEHLSATAGDATTAAQARPATPPSAPPASA